MGDGRNLTLLMYLNDGWTREQGGALRVYPPGGRASVWCDVSTCYCHLPLPCKLFVVLKSKPYYRKP